MSLFEHFLESLESVPPELERNFTLIRELDSKCEELMEKIKKISSTYADQNTKYSRDRIRKETDTLFAKLNSYSEDKFELAQQTYELIDRNIIKLNKINDTPEEDEAPKIGYDMPLDSNEPKFCICRGVSHGDMIACDNDECPIEWFHYACVNITSPPNGRWFCQSCSNLIKRPKSRGRKSVI